MAWRSAAVVVLLVVSLGAAARAETEKELADEIQGLVGDQEYGQASRQAEQAVAEYPDSGALHFLLGKLLAASFDLTRARGELEAAIARAPDLAEAHAQLAFVTRRAGDNQAAMIHARRALELDPSASRCQELVSELEIAARIGSGAQPDVAAGSPEAAAVRFFELVRAGELEQAFQRYLAPELVDHVLQKAGTAELGIDRSESVRQLSWGLSAGLGQLGVELGGILVEPAQREGDRARVSAWVLAVARSSESDRWAKVTEMVASRKLVELVGPEMSGYYAHLEPPDRERWLQNFGRYPEQTVTRVEVDLSRSDAGPWQIADVTVVHREGRWALSDAIENLGQVMEAMGEKLPNTRPIEPFGKERAGPAGRRSVARRVADVVALLAIILVMLAVAWRWARRR